MGRLRIAETVTFGGGGLDRAAHLRADATAISRLRKQENAQSIVLWRNNILVSGSEDITLARRSIDRGILYPKESQSAFLGLQDGAAVFAHDILGKLPENQHGAEIGNPENTEIANIDIPAGHRFVDLRDVMAQLTPLDAELAASAKALFGWHDSHGYCGKCGNATLVTMAGWQRQCPTCQSHHFPRTDPVVIMLITRGNNVLFGRSPHWPEQMYSLLAGFVEPGETLENAVRREVMEEVGVPVGPVRYLASQPWPFPASLMVGCQGDALNDEITIDPVEIENALWISQEDLMDVFAGRNSDILPARSGSIARFLLENWLADRLE